MDNLYVHCQLAINRFISREKNFVTHKQQCLQAVDCNDIRFQDGKRIHTLGAQSVHAYQVNSQTQTTVWTPPFHETSYCRGLLLLYLLCRNQDSDFIRWCAICDYYFLGELLGVRWASYFSNILRFWVYLFLENNTICHLQVFETKDQPQFIFVNKLSIVFRLLDMDQDCLSPTCDWWFLIGVPVQMLLITVATLTPKSPLPEGHTPTAHFAT
jgi:hypothetical protein